jgi:ribosome-binding ATPase
VKIGLVGKPNVGKSTFFKAATLKDVAIADYPFTTIEPNVGVAYVRAKCPHIELGVQCKPNHGECRDGTRFVPVDLVDVAGLVPGAHEGRGLGNKFLDDLRRADALIHVVDASGSSDAEGRPVGPGSRDPLEDVRFLEDEFTWWIDGILAKDWDRIFKRVQVSGEKLETLVHEKLTFLGLSEKMVAAAIREGGLDHHQLAASVRRLSKPILVAFNKSDKVPKERIAELGGRLGDATWQSTAADAEIALRAAAKAGLIRYEPGAASFELVDPAKLSAKQRQALDYIRDHVLAPHGTTGVMPALERAVYDLLKLIVVYPVEDEAHYTDKKGNVLPDAHLVPQGLTAKDLAFRVHTQLGENFVRAIDGRTRRVIGADHALQNGDVVRIVAHA